MHSARTVNGRGMLNDKKQAVCSSSVRGRFVRELAEATVPSDEP